MNGLSNLIHIARKTGDNKCDNSRPECGTKSNGMIVISKSQEFGDSIRNYVKGNFRPCKHCLNAAHEQGRIGDKTFALGLEIRAKKK